MKHLIKKILRESSQEKFIGFIINKLMSGEIKAPYFKNMNPYGLNDGEIEMILSNFFDGKVDLKEKKIYGLNGQTLYAEKYGNWFKQELDDNGNVIYYENSYGHWSRSKYNEKGKMIEFRNHKGEWFKKELDEMGRELYYVNSDGEWVEREYNDAGEMIYYEDSDRGVIIDKR